MYNIHNIINLHEHVHIPTVSNDYSHLLVPEANPPQIYLSSDNSIYHACTYNDNIILLTLWYHLSTDAIPSALILVKNGYCTAYFSLPIMHNE